MTTSKTERENRSMRKALSKRLRFEIFKRDGFKCLYCGVTPAQKVLRVDHVKPVAEGGTDDPPNLVTSCFDCNAGKGPVPLEKRKHAAGIASAADKEHAEQIREWLKVQRDIEKAKGGIVDDLLGIWQREIDAEPAPDMRARLRNCLGRNSAEDIREAIYATATKRLYSSRQLKYFYGVLRAKRGEAPEPQPPEPQRPRRSPRAERVMRHMVAWQKAQTQHTITDVLLEFASAAWASPAALEYADYYDPDQPGCERSRIRGLTLRTERVDQGKIRWWVEDDTETIIAIELLNEIRGAANEESYQWSALHAPPSDGAPLTTRDECLQAQKTAQAHWNEAEEFLRYLKTGDETQLRACREHFGWPCPKWRVD